MRKALLVFPLCIPFVASFCTFLTSRAQSGLSNEETAELQRKTQNPVSDLISLPFQYNLNLDYGTDNGEQHIMNIQPVIPFGLNEDWNLISRTIMPLIQMPELLPGKGEQFGLPEKKKIARA